ncbi:MAG: leucyl aminopeptidase [Pseudomonadota bacterium]
MPSISAASSASKDAPDAAGGPVRISFSDRPLDAVLPGEARDDAPSVLVFFSGGGEADLSLGPAAEAADRLSEGQVRRALKGASGSKGEVVTLTAPHGVHAPSLMLVGLGAEPLDAAGARTLGASVTKALASAKAATAVVRLEGLSGEADAALLAAELAHGLRLRAYRFDARKSKSEAGEPAEVSLEGPEAAAAEEAHGPLLAVADGVTFARDLVNEPANFLYPEEFAQRVKALEAHGLKVEVLGEAALEKLGMGALLAVGRGSRRESFVVTVEWRGAKDKSAAPLALIGKGVCFDTGGVSLKPPGGMEEMTMDMGGAAVVAGVMKALALRKSPVNVVGLLGLVENMPDGDAQRPGDVVTAMSGDTIEVINTDAEGRLVLADVIHYAQETFKPSHMVDLATLTGAIIVALGHHKAGLFANDDDWAAAIEKAADAEGEGIWRMPLGAAYDKTLKSRIADMKNVGGRQGGSITAAQFIQRFVKEGASWAHIDIAGVAMTKEPGPVWPKGASGWGVATLVRLAESMND